MAFGSPGAIPQFGAKHSRIGRRVAAALALAFTLASAIALFQGGVRWPETRAFLPICATLWATADLLTAFFLFAQYNVGGRIAYALIAASYGFGGLLTIPYLALFPGVFSEPPFSLGALQISAWLWVTWHCAFPVLIAITHLVDPTLERRIVPRDDIARVLGTIGLGTVGVAIGLGAFVVLAHDRLPTIVLPGGHFTGLYSATVAPVVVACNLFALIVLSARVRQPTRLQVWLAIALLASAYDGILNAAAPGRYTVAWYVGKFESLTTASIVLVVLLFEVGTLYRRLFDAAGLDPLTGLANRRRLDDDLRGILRGRIADAGLAMLVVDIDHFKEFNDVYGHQSGDDALRRVATILRGAAYRRQDIVARSGGDEFIVILPGISLEDARVIAERVRRSIESADIGGESAALLRLTVSVGLGYTDEPDRAAVDQLYASADRVLYTAKDGGRNRIAWSAGATAQNSYQ